MIAAAFYKRKPVASFRNTGPAPLLTIEGSLAVILSRNFKPMVDLRPPFER